MINRAQTAWGADSLGESKDTNRDAAALEWDNEPDKIQYTDPDTGLSCLVTRHPELGSLCGYVGVPPGHPYYGLEYEKIPAEAHGGVTFAGKCMDREDWVERVPEDLADPRVRVCHVVEPGEEDNVWWIGFACAHSWDFVPGLGACVNRAMGRPAGQAGPDQTYRTVDYVKGQNAKLARQLKAAA